MAQRPKSGAADPTRMFGEMRMPAMPDMEALLSTYRRNVEVLTAANRVAMEGAQAVAKRNVEILQQTMAELSDTMRSMMTVDTPQTGAAKQAELMKRAYENALVNFKELSDLIQHANGEAMGLLNRRFMEAMDEVKVLMEKAGEKRAE